MKRLSLVTGAAAVLVVAASCSPGADPDSGPDDGAADDTFALTAEEVWQRYPIGAEWTHPMLGDGESVITARSEDRPLDICDGTTVEFPESGELVEAGLTGSQSRSLMAETVVFPDQETATAFHADLVEAARACDAWTELAEEPGPIFVPDTPEQAAQRARWTGTQFTFGSQSWRGAVAYRTRGNVVTRVEELARGSDETAGSDAVLSMGDSLAILLNALDGQPTELPAIPSLVDPNTVCGVLSDETVARLLAPSEYAVRAISKSSMTIDCQFSSTQIDRVLNVKRLKVESPDVPDGAVASATGVVATKDGASILVNINPDPGLTEAQWQAVADEMLANM
jgi:hypothetical protein